MQKSKLQFQIQKFYFLVVVLSFAILVFSFNEVKAAELKLDSQTQELAVGQQFQINVLLNTEGEEINAVEGRVVFPDIVELKEIRDGNSIINFWIERPSLNSKFYILYSGVTPGGFNGEKSLIFSAIFEAKKEGSGIIEIQDAGVLKNDGLGTSADVKISNFQFNIKEVGLPREVRLPEIKDTERPETFRPEIAREESLFEGKWFLVFATQDKASGVDHYEIKESRQRILSMFKKWTSAESPHVLEDQELRSFVWIKAVDKAGNERIIKIAPRNSLTWYENYENWIMIVIGLLIIAFAARKLWKKQLT